MNWRATEPQQITAGRSTYDSDREPAPAVAFSGSSIFIRGSRSLQPQAEDEEVDKGKVSCAHKDC